MPTLRVLDLISNDQAQDYRRLTAGGIPGYGLVRVFQMRRNAGVRCDSGIKI